MANTNDATILQLKKLIDAKKEKLGTAARFVPVTNCSIELDGQRLNINTLNKEQLTLLAVKLQSYLIAAKTLDVSEDFSISGYHVSDWIEDLQSKLNIQSRIEEAKKLKAMENKLEQLLSEDKKVELELNDIASFLNG